MTWEEIVHSMPGPGRVDSDYGEFVIRSDHPPDGAHEGRDPTPWTQFLASMGSCMASFVMDHCERHGLPYDGIRLRQRQRFAEGERMTGEIVVSIEVPDDFPVEHRAALVEAAERCTVKRVIEAAPTFRIGIAPEGPA